VALDSTPRLRLAASCSAAEAMCIVPSKRGQRRPGPPGGAANGQVLSRANPLRQAPQFRPSGTASKYWLLESCGTIPMIPMGCEKFLELRGYGFGLSRSKPDRQIDLRWSSTLDPVRPAVSIETNWLPSMVGRMLPALPPLSSQFP
jgi:hypothetical protein